jgi:hypothetical protein
MARTEGPGGGRDHQAAGLAAGLDPALLSGHSLRAGFATEACAQGVPELAIMRHGR